MAGLTSRIAVFPGCSLEGAAGAFEASMTGVFEALGVKWATLKDWSCCGATSAHAMDHHLHLALTLRNLALAEEQGYDEVLAPCAACFHRLARAQHGFHDDAAVRTAANEDTGLHYKGTVAVRNILDFLAHDVGLEAIAARVVRRLDFKVACYYGCLNTRLPRVVSFDDREYPMAMDKIVSQLGAHPLDWSYKTECCGASLFVTAEEVSARLAGKILRDAAARGADCVAVACPMCHNNLDTKQDLIRAEFGIERPLPVLFITQLMGLAFGLSEASLRLEDSFTPVGEMIHHGR